MEHPLHQPRADEPGDPSRRTAGPADTVDLTADAGPVPAALDLESLRRKVASQPTIEQAKGMLMAYYGIDAEEAFALLRRWSSGRHVKLRDLCRTVVEAGTAPGPHPYAGLRALLGPPAPHDQARG